MLMIICIIIIIIIIIKTKIVNFSYFWHLSLIQTVMRLLNAGDFQNLLSLVILHDTPSFIINGFLGGFCLSLNLFLTLAYLSETVISFERKVLYSSFSKKNEAVPDLPITDSCPFPVRLSQD